MILNTMLLLSALAVFAYIAIIAFAYLMADKMIYPFPEPSYEGDESIIKLSSEDGEQIAACYLVSETREHLLIYSHGNGEDLGSIRPLLEIFRKRGVSVFAYDYPGYGESSGSPSEEGVFASANSAYKYVTEELGYSPEQVVLYGRSLGSGPSCWLAERYAVGGLILDGAFSSTFRVMTKIRILPWDRFNNLARLPSINCPILMLHGKKDRTVPFVHALKNQKAASGPVTALWSETAGHNDLIEQLGPEYWDTVLQFINEVHR